jgi:hypothetical protein
LELRLGPEERMMNVNQAKKLVELIQELVKAEIQDSWKGGGDPLDVPIIEEELREAQENLSNYIEELTEE